MITNDTDAFYIGIPEDAVEGLSRMGPALHFYLWLVKNRWLREGAEQTAHVGPWIRRGLIVVRLVRSDYAKIAGVTPRTVTNYIARLQELGDLRVVSQGHNVGETNAPVVLAIGIWQALPGGKRWAIYDGWLDMLHLAGPNPGQNEAELRQILGVKAPRKAKPKTPTETPDSDPPGNIFPPPPGKNVPPPPGKIFPPPLENSFHLSLTDTPNGTTPNRDCGEVSPRPALGIQEKAEGQPSAEHDPKVRLPGETLQEHMDRIRAKVRERASVPPAPPAPAPAPAAKKGGKKSRPKAEPKERARNPMFDAVAPHVAGSSDETAIKVAAPQIAKVVKYLAGIGVTPEQVPAMAEFIQKDCFVTRQPEILPGSWEKFAARWINSVKGATSTRAQRLMEVYTQPRPEVASDPDDDFDYSDGGNLLL